MLALTSARYSLTTVLHAESTRQKKIADGTLLYTILCYAQLHYIRRTYTMPPEYTIRFLYMVLSQINKLFKGNCIVCVPISNPTVIIFFKFDYCSVTLYTRKGSGCAKTYVKRAVGYTRINWDTRSHIISFA